MGEPFYKLAGHYVLSLMKDKLPPFWNLFSSHTRLEDQASSASGTGTFGTRRT